MKRISATLILLLFVFSCASQPDDINAIYVSPATFASYDCEQVESSLRSKNTRLSQLYNSLKAEADADAWQTGVGLFLFWPTLLFLEGNDGAEAEEYRRLKGEVTALQEVATQKKCGFE
tara:strand:+ start:91 stop:447 length:357 start_codon:yes stop_codon:yes gene_type:complete